MAGIQFGNSAGESRPKLTAEVFGAQRQRVCTIIFARFAMFPTPSGGTDRQLFVTFNEWPDLELRCNKSMASAFQKLVEAGKLPNQTDVSGNPMWAGCRVPLELRGYRNPNGGPDVEKPTPLHPDLFDVALHASVPPRPAPAPAPAALPAPAPARRSRSVPKSHRNTP